VRPLPAGRTGRQVLVETSDLTHRELAVEPRGDRRAALVAVHEVQVVRQGLGVPASYFLLVDALRGWAEAAGQGDAVAAGHLVRATQAEVRRLCSHLGSPAEADDLAQETFERALRALPRFRGEAPVRLWLLSIARRTCADALRRRQRRSRLTVRLLGLAGDVQPAAHGSAAEDELLATLEPDRRAAFVLTQLLGLSYAEAATACGVPVGTIRSRVARARADLLTAHRAAETA
jgi:RNA polymerase sigma-70 factor (ECF subfamily)